LTEIHFFEVKLTCYTTTENAQVIKKLCKSVCIGDLYITNYAHKLICVGAFILAQG